MKCFISIATAFLLLVLAQTSYAQDKPGIKERFKLFRNKVEKLSSDTIQKPQVRDSLKEIVGDTIKQKKENGVRLSLSKPSLSKPDSLDLSYNPLDSMKQAGFKSGSGLPDSLRNLGLPSTHAGDSITRKAADVSEQLSEKSQDVGEKLKAGADSLGLPDPLNGIKSKTDNSKLANPGIGTMPGLVPESNTAQLPATVAPNVGISNVKIPDAGLSTNVPSLPDATLTGKQPALPGVSIPNIDAAKDVTDKIPAHIPEIHAPDSSQVKELKTKALANERLQKYAEPVAEVSDKLDPYKKNLDSLTVKDAATLAETEAEQALQNTSVMKTLTGNSSQLKSAMSPADMALLQRYQDKRILKDEMLRKSKNVMNDKLSSFAPQVQSQQKKLSKVKKLNASVPSVKNLKVKRTDPLKERPFYERIVPGVSLQSYSGNVFALDVAPQVSLRLNSFWSVGSGMLYRAGFDKKYSAFVQGQGVSGFRAFVDCRLVKGLFVHAEYEKLKVSDRFDFSDRITTPEFNSAYIGLGKRYPLSRKFNGSLIALYKIEMGDHLAGTTKFNLRVVFEYKTKKVRKATSID